jgi:phage shock protein E
MSKHPKETFQVGSVTVNAITMDYLFEAAQNLAPKAVILDVRSQEEYAEGHVPGAKLIPVDEVESRASELQGIEHLYLYCRAGRRAGMAFQALRAHGLEKLGLKQIDVVDEGGFPDWEEAGYPVQAG